MSAPRPAAEPSHIAAIQDDRAGTMDHALRVLADVFGHSSFRQGQDAVIEAVLTGRDCVAVMPTGSGKTVTFQVPARMLHGPVVVVSPLIALMEDQVARARDRGLRAVRIGGDGESRELVARRLTAEPPELVYIAPEGLEAGWLDVLRPMRVGLLAVDEAHCIERWGPEFRPSYLGLGEVRAALGSPGCLAVTASASPRTVTRIAEVLRMRDPVQVRTSCLRPNLTLRALCCRDQREQSALVARYVRDSRGCGIVYARSRDGADASAALLRRRGIAAESYHAHMERAERTAVQKRFLSGRTPVVVATVAFGMGIDKPDVRWVLHRGLPETMDAYYQEVGRAGRDGEPSDCLLLWSPTDMGVHRALRRSVESAQRRDEAVVASAGMMRFAGGSGCRHAVVARHFGEVIERCGDRCDVCRPALDRRLAALPG